MFVGLFSNDEGNSGGDTGAATTTTTAATSAPGTTVPTAPDDLATTCAPDVLTTSVQNGEFLVRCEKECLKAECCWKANHASSCAGADACTAYMGPCGEHLVTALANLEGKPWTGAGATTTTAPATTSPKPASEFDTELSKEIASSCNSQVAFFLKTKCESACSPGSCCFDGDTATCTAGMIDCDMFAPCSVLHDRRRLRH